MVTGFAKVEAALARGRGRGACCMRPTPRADGVAQARRRAAPAAATTSAIAVIDGFHGGPIGFGIGTVKCGTCSPACRAGERHVSGAMCSALSAFGPATRTSGGDGRTAELTAELGTE